MFVKEFTKSLKGTQEPCSQLNVIEGVGIMSELKLILLACTNPRGIRFVLMSNNKLLGIMIRGENNGLLVVYKFQCDQY